MSNTSAPRSLAPDLGSATPADLDRVLGLLPEITWIEDPTLRDRVARIWVHAWRTGPWPDPADAQMIGYHQRWNVAGHTRAATVLVRAVAEQLDLHSGIEVDQDALLAAALLHDVAKLIEWGPGPQAPEKTEVGRTIHHAPIGAQWALEAGLAPAIAQAIYAHTSQATNDPTTLEGLIVKKVDSTLAEVTRMAVAIAERAQHNT